MNKRHTYVIAEAGVNHNGSLEMAKQLIEVAANAGADAVKFQTFKAGELVSKGAPKAEYQARTTGGAESQLEMIRKLELDEEAHVILMRHCQECGIEFLSTPFDLESVDLLVNGFDLPRLKLSSGEITNGPLLLKVAQSGKPVILSTGMSNLGEIEAALGVLAFGYLQPELPPSSAAFRACYAMPEGQEVLRQKVVLLHCTTEYPAPLADVNLRAMDTMRSAFGLPVGFSDHTQGITTAIAAAAREAVVLEKHFTLDRNLPGPDHAASLNPDELTSLIDCIRQVDLALGAPHKAPTASDLKNIKVARKSLVACTRIRAGERFTTDNVAVKRPGTGISPMNFWDILGHSASVSFEKDELLR